MGWQLVNKPLTQKVTKKLAKEFAEMDPAPHDRPLSERRLQVYQRMLKEGQFRPVTWAKAICAETNGIYRVNGKHTAIMLSGLEVLPEFFVTIEEYTCETLEDVARLYATFDSGIQSRTARDIYASFAATVPELKELPVGHIALAVAGITMHESAGSTSATKHGQPAERAEKLFDNVDWVVWMSGILSTGGPGGKMDRQIAKHLKRQPVTAAMYGSWLKAKAAATEFWSAVRDETGLSPQLPDRKLAKYLSTVAVDNGGGGRKIRAVSTREMYVKCIHAWNAWRKNESTNLNYYVEAGVPGFR